MNIGTIVTNKSGCAVCPQHTICPVGDALIRTIGDCTDCWREWLEKGGQDV